MAAEIEVHLLRAQLAKLQSERGPDPTGGGGGGPHMPDMSERMTKLEGAFEGLKRVQDITVLSVVGVGAILIALMLYSLNRIDVLSEHINKIPSEISSDLRDITKTLAESITAAKQQPPQIILVPAPQQQPPKP
jgi:hypothetical protein